MHPSQGGRVTAQRVAVVGAGIAGLAHAWSAAERGHHVTLFERSPRAVGASIRNFGMIWPIGQPAGNCHATALRSRERWLRLSTEAGLWVNPCGSIHLAHRDDEWTVLQQFQERSKPLGYTCELLTPAQVAARTSAANLDGLIGGLFSSTELCVDPRQVVRVLPEWLNRRHDVRLCFGNAVASITDRCLVTADQSTDRFDRIVVCPGADLQSLFPDDFASSGLKLCKLQ